VYDTWDGSDWTRSDEGQGALVSDGVVEPAPDDVAAERGVESTQEFRIEVGVATAVPTAPSAVGVEAAQQLAQRPDGTLVTATRPLSRGATYTVQSRQVPTDPDRLRAAGDEIPAAVLDRYAGAPVATERVVALAASITGGATNDYDRIRAIERWMDDNTEYSLDAPLAPKGVDVVDDFLFESREGWCEQIASSLVVLARLSGVPARLATGFAPGEWDAVGSRFVVRERDAHAWVEVWFPDTGWVTFDPTAVVPLAGTAEATPGAAAVDWRQVAGLALAAVGVVALALGPLRRWLGRRRSRRRSAAPSIGDPDAARIEAQIERAGAAVGRRREPSETISAYAGEVSLLAQSPELAEQGRELDRRYYSGAGPRH
jgi:transglutaminase-like putative cysteine protease